MGIEVQHFICIIREESATLYNRNYSGFNSINCNHVQYTCVHNKCPRYPGERDIKGFMSFSFRAVNLFSFICLVSLSVALGVLRA